MGAGGGSGAFVGRFANVPAAKPGRLDVELLGQAGLLNQVFEDTIGHGAPANVAEAHKANVDVWHWLRIIREFA